MDSLRSRLNSLRGNRNAIFKRFIDDRMDTRNEFRSNVLEWLSTGVNEEPLNERIFSELCRRLVHCQIALSRVTLHLLVHHPQWLGTRLIWTRGRPDAVIQTVAYEVEASDAFLRSPFRQAIATGKVVRQKLQIVGPHVFAVYEELRQQGHTDYVAWPFDHTEGRRHLITFSTDKDGGFQNDEIALLAELLPIYTLVTEIRVKNQLAKTLLETYVGSYAGEQILQGAITRGSGVTINAGILICDLRNFSRLSDQLPRDELIEILNNYFDVVAEPIEKYGGEILKFIGDGLLSVFPLEVPGACHRLLQAVREAHVAACGPGKLVDGIKFGTGIHIGEVMYGNIGSKKRLDFTVIGSAVNTAFKLEALTKTLQRPILASRDFVVAADCFAQTDYLGRHTLHKIDVAVDVHAVNL